MSLKALLLSLSLAATLPAAIDVHLSTNVSSPQPVGSAIGLIPRLTVAPPAKLNYRYSVSVDGGPSHIVRDFSQDPTFVWAPALHEQSAVIRLTVRNDANKETAETELPFQIVPRIKGPDPILTPTSHPLIALFSAPACPTGTEIRAAFRPKGSGDDQITRTPTRACRESITNNEYIAGLRADSDYEIRAEWVTGNKLKTGDWLPFHSGTLDGRFPPIRTIAARAQGRITRDPINIRSSTDPWRIQAADTEGNIVWYLNPASNSFLTRVLPNGHFLVLADGSNSVNDMRRWQLVREIDLLGHVVRETNIGRVAEQLASRGIQSECKTGGQQCVPGFHHEAIRLPNGHTLVLAGIERMMPAGTQGSKEPVDVLGDLIIDLDEEFQLSWVWNAFDHMDLKRASLGDEKCKVGPGDDGCTPVFLAPEANGWLHSNALSYTPSRDLLVSMPEQDWVIKVDYQDGKGSGKLLWRLGKDGDFKANSNDPYPWFSYQHDANFDPETNLFIVFDDGHRRKDKFPNANNRGQVWRIDERNMVATPVVNADLGVYAVAVGSAQQLNDGNYSWESGFINPGPAGLGATYSRTTETYGNGSIAWSQQVDGQLTYRSFRVPNMYIPPRK